MSSSRDEKTYVITLPNRENDETDPIVFDSLWQIPGSPNLLLAAGAHGREKCLLINIDNPSQPIFTYMPIPKIYWLKRKLTHCYQDPSNPNLINFSGYLFINNKGNAAMFTFTLDLANQTITAMDQYLFEIRPMPVKTAEQEEDSKTSSEIRYSENEQIQKRMVKWNKELQAFAKNDTSILPLPIDTEISTWVYNEKEYDLIYSISLQNKKNVALLYSQIDDTNLPLSIVRTISRAEFDRQLKPKTDAGDAKHSDNSDNNTADKSLAVSVSALASLTIANTTTGTVNQSATTETSTQPSTVSNTAPALTSSQ